MIKKGSVGIRAIEEDDLILLRDWRNIAEFRENFREFRELNMKMQKDWFEHITKSPDNLMFTIVRLKDNKPIGACGLVYINWIVRSADISFYIGEKKYYIDSKGYADDAVKIIIKYAFGELNLNKLWTEVYEFDRKKISFFEKYKFKKDAILRDNCFKDGKYWNSYIYSLLRRETTRVS